MVIPLFPLSMCLLPHGFSQLRIFEPRYKRLVTESLKSNSGFGLCMLHDDKKHMLPIGTLCKIIDFETLDDGLLGISIQGEKKFHLKDFTIEDDGLKRGTIEIIDDWPTSIINIAESKKVSPNQTTEKMLSDTLREILNQYPEHLAQYQNEHFDDISWVCQRWLEIIPLTAAEKYHCINNHDHKMAQDYLSNIIK